MYSLQVCKCLDTATLVRELVLFSSMDCPVLVLSTHWQTALIHLHLTTCLTVMMLEYAACKKVNACSIMYALLYPCDHFYTCLLMLYITLLPLKLWCHVFMEQYGLWMALHLMREELKYASVENGGQCVTTVGTEGRLKWSADNSDTTHHVLKFSTLPYDIQGITSG